MPQISVIVPVYNVEKYLHRCVDSILAQTFTDFELILVDDGSIDSSAKICDEYAEKNERVRAFHRENKGPAAARNIGIDWAIQNSDSRWIAFVDSDDWVHEEYLELLYTATARNEGTAVLCDVLETDQYSRMDTVKNFDCKKESIEIAFIENRYSMAPVAKLLPKSVFNTLRFPEGKFAEDIFTIYKALFQCEDAVLIDGPLYYYYQNADSVTKTLWSPRKLDEIEGFEEMIAFFEEKTLKKALQRASRAYCYVLAEQYNRIQSSKNPVYSQYGKQIRQKLRRSLRKYHMYLNGSFREKTCLYESAYPSMMNMYWKTRVVYSRLRKILPMIDRGMEE